MHDSMQTIMVFAYVFKINFDLSRQMSLVVAFNTVLVQFMKELSETFPSDQKMKIYRLIVEGLCQGEATVGVDTFRDALSPFEDRIRARDETLFDVVEPLFGQVDLGAIWKSGLSDVNKTVVWEYLEALVGMVPPVAGVPATEQRALVPADGSFGAADGSFGADALKNLVPGMPPEIGDAVSQMMQGVDMQDIMALAQDIDEKDVQDIVGALDPAAMTSLMSDFSLDKLMDVAKNIDPASLTKIADKFDKDRLAKVASKVDQEALLKMLNPSLSSKRGSKRR